MTDSSGSGAPAPVEATQDEITREIQEDERGAIERGVPSRHPLRDYAPYRSSVLRHPTHELVRVDPEEIERTSPAFGHVDVDPYEADLTIQHPADPLGERIVVAGRGLDGGGRPVRNQLIEGGEGGAPPRHRPKSGPHPPPPPPPPPP